MHAASTQVMNGALHGRTLQAYFFKYIIQLNCFYNTCYFNLCTAIATNWFALTVLHGGIKLLFYLILM